MLISLQYTGLMYGTVWKGVILYKQRKFNCMFIIAMDDFWQYYLKLFCRNIKILSWRSDIHFSALLYEKTVFGWSFTKGFLNYGIEVRSDTLLFRLILIKHPVQLLVQHMLLSSPNGIHIYSKSMVPIDALSLVKKLHHQISPFEMLLLNNVKIPSNNIHDENILLWYCFVVLVYELLFPVMISLIEG